MSINSFDHWFREAAKEEQCSVEATFVTVQEFTTPYTPEQNGLIERFIRTLKENCIWQQRFESLAHAQMAIGLWIRY